MSNPPIVLLIDGACPLCAREARLMRRLDRGRGRVAFVDIAAPGFDASSYGLTRADVMGSLHGITAEGRIVTGMEVFRRAYGALGWGWLLAPTRWPGLRGIFDALYAWFARNRLRLAGRAGCETETCAPRGGR